MPSKTTIGFGFRIIARIIKADDGLKYMPGLDSSNNDFDCCALFLFCLILR